MKSAIYALAVWMWMLLAPIPALPNDSPAYRRGTPPTILGGQCQAYLVNGWQIYHQNKLVLNSYEVEFPPFYQQKGGTSPSLSGENGPIFACNEEKIWFVLYENGTPAILGYKLLNAGFGEGKIEIKLGESFQGVSNGQNGQTVTAQLKSISGLLPSLPTSRHIGIFGSFRLLGGEEREAFQFYEVENWKLIAELGKFDLYGKAIEEKCFLESTRSLRFTLAVGNLLKHFEAGFAVQESSAGCQGERHQEGASTGNRTSPWGRSR